MQLFCRLLFLKHKPAITTTFIDPETGLYYYRSRYYDPRIGRFIQEDPIGFFGGVNFYTYCDNNPINWIAPWGWCKGKPWWKPDPGFWERFWTQFYKDRLPIINWFSFLPLPIPKGAIIVGGVGIGKRGLQRVIIREATRKYTSFSGTRHFVYMAGYKPRYFIICKVIERTVLIIAVAATAADIGTAIESAVEVWREESGC